MPDDRPEKIVTLRRGTRIQIGAEHEIRVLDDPGKPLTVLIRSWSHVRVSRLSVDKKRKSDNT